MNRSTIVKTIASIAAGTIAAVLWLQCGPTQPIDAQTPNSSGNGGQGSPSPTAGNADSAGGHQAGGDRFVLTTPLPGGAGGSASSSTVEVVPASVDVNCGTQTKNPTPQPVDLLLVLDRSGSMGNDIVTDTACSTGSGRRDAAPCTTKWPAMTASLKQVLAASPAGVQWGLKFFTSPKGGNCTVNSGADVAVGPGTATQIQTAIAGTSPANQTPTRDAINAAVAYFGTVNDGLVHYILLATDGQPNCDDGSSSQVTTTSVANTATAISAAATAGIKTYVIGIGSSAGNLTEFAQNGGTTDYYPATSPDQLTAALSSIVVAVASCTFTMAAVPPDPTNLGVYLDKNTKVPLDASDGYSLAADNVTVTLNGSYCDGLKGGTYQVVQVYFGCPGAPPPPIIP